MPKPDNTPSLNTGILIIAHAPLASALKACALHIFPDKEAFIQICDVLPQTTLENGLEPCLQLVQQFQTQQLLVLTDIIGATPFNLSQKLITTLVETQNTQKSFALKLISGVNMPMLIRALSYMHEPLDKVAQLAIEGATRSILDVTPCGAETDQLN